MSGKNLIPILEEENTINKVVMSKDKKKLIFSGLFTNQKSLELVDELIRLYSKEDNFSLKFSLDASTSLPNSPRDRFHKGMKINHIHHWIVTEKEELDYCKKTSFGWIIIQGVKNVIN
ncbi:MAG TPA: hypothetical protein PLA41_01200 [Candidatus Pacearchaeota archaeon]|nr:hypothetical protein [Candidatus Pacearchaeota archaeon]HQI74726.1 hypothetical protein [Candidatus Pacearchaeota archaeon]